MYSLGQQTRKQYSGSRFLPYRYDPTTVLVRGPNDNPSIISGYSYVMGIYSGSVEGIDLMPAFDSLNDIQITNKEIDQVRYDIGSSRPVCADQRLDLYPGNDDREYLVKPLEMYSGQQNKIKKQLNDAANEFEGKYGNRLYEDMGLSMQKDYRHINFGNAIFYLDDYIVAKANGKGVPYEFDLETQDLINQYYKQYYQYGYFRDENLNRVFTDSYFTNLGKEVLLKYENVKNRNNRDKFVNNLLTSVHIANHQTYVAVMHQLGERNDYTPDFGQKIDWTLIDRNGEYYVRASANGRPLFLEGNANTAGEIEIGAFFKYLWSKLFYGDYDLVIRGIEAPGDFYNSKIHSINYLRNKNSLEDSVLLKNLNEFIDKPRLWNATQTSDESYSSSYYAIPASSTWSEWGSSETSRPSSGYYREESGTSSQPSNYGSSSYSESSSSSSDSYGASYSSITPEVRPKSRTQRTTTFEKQPSSQSTELRSKKEEDNIKPIEVRQQPEETNTYYNSQLIRNERPYTGQQESNRSSYQQQYVQRPQQQRQQQPKQMRGRQDTLKEEHVILDEVIAPASVLKGLVENSPAYDWEERNKINAPTGSVTYVEPSNYDYVQTDIKYERGETIEQPKYSRPTDAYQTKTQYPTSSQNYPQRSATYTANPPQSYSGRLAPGSISTRLESTQPTTRTAIKPSMQSQPTKTQKETYNPSQSRLIPESNLQPKGTSSAQTSSSPQVQPTSTQTRTSGQTQPATTQARTSGQTQPSPYQASSTVQNQPVPSQTSSSTQARTATQTSSSTQTGSTTQTSSSSINSTTKSQPEPGRRVIAKPETPRKLSH